MTPVGKILRRELKDEEEAKRQTQTADKVA